MTDRQFKLISYAIVIAMAICTIIITSGCGYAHVQTDDIEVTVYTFCKDISYGDYMGYTKDSVWKYNPITGAELTVTGESNE